jgi:hypothetical protein
LALLAAALPPLAQDDSGVTQAVVAAGAAAANSAGATVAVGAGTARRELPPGAAVELSFER